MAKNIEMNYKDESGYEILRPQTTCEMVIDLLNEDTKELMGLSPSDQADDAFRKIYLAQVLDGRALINFTVMGDDGTPCKGVQIESSQFCDANGNKTTPVETDDNGKVSVFVDNISVQASISKYANLSDWSETIPVEFGQQYDKSITLTRYNFKLWESSGSCKFSPEIVRVDVSLCGGGGGGGAVSNVDEEEGSFYQKDYGEGGGGGYCAIYDSVSFQKNYEYTYSVGSGGAAGYNGNGGKSSFGEHSVNGGNGVVYDHQGGQGNGQGGGRVITGNGLPGGSSSSYIYISFTEQVLAGGGGGSGAGIYVNLGDGSGRYFYGGRGGTKGGKGGDCNDNGVVSGGQNGQKYGGGGGGGGHYMEVVSNKKRLFTGRSSGNGAQGCVAIRMYRQQDLST